MYTDILLPTDGSAGMDTVIDHAQGLAERYGATIHALYVVDTGTMSRLPVETSWEAISSTFREEGEQALQAVENRAHGVDVETRLVEGEPSRKIRDVAETEDCDIVVMGTHGRGGLDRLLLGSVAERVVRTAPVPVLTVRVGDD